MPYKAFNHYTNMDTNMWMAETGHSNNNKYIYIYHTKF